VKATNKHAHHAREIIYSYPPNTPEKYLQGGKFLFMAYGCAIIERQTPSGAYVYIVSNLSTGERRIISRPRIALIKTVIAKWLGKYASHPIAGMVFTP